MKLVFTKGWKDGVWRIDDTLVRLDDDRQALVECPELEAEVIAVLLELGEPQDPDEIIDDVVDIDDLDDAYLDGILTRHGDQLTEEQHMALGRLTAEEVWTAEHIRRFAERGLTVDVWPKSAVDAGVKDREYQVTYRAVDWTKRTGNKSRTFDSIHAVEKFVLELRGGPAMTYVNVTERRVSQWRRTSATARLEALARGHRVAASGDDPSQG